MVKLKKVEGWSNVVQKIKPSLIKTISVDNMLDDSVIIKRGSRKSFSKRFG